MVLEQVLKSDFPMVIKASAGSGKCILGDTLIYTNNGMSSIEDIYESQKISSVISHDGANRIHNSLPSGIYKIEHFDNVIRLRTSLGYEICGTPEHRVYVFDPDEIKPVYKKLSEITDDDTILLSRGSNSFPCSQNDWHDTDMAYVLGVCIGDGYFPKSGNVIRITKKDDYFRNRFVSICDNLKIKSYVTYREKRDNHIIVLRDVKSIMDDYGITPNLSGDKSIPPKILRSSKKVISSFLSGLFDTDAGFHTNTIEYSTKSETMAKQIHIILLNFGIISRLDIKNVKGIDYYRISITSANMKIFRDNIGFRLSRHKLDGLNTYLESKKLNTNIDCIKPYAIIDSSDFVGNVRSVKDYSTKRRRPTAYSIGRMLSINPNAKNLKEYESLIKAFYFDNIKSISTEYAEYVFDYTVPVYHNFVGNGFVNHNTYALVEKIKTMIDENISPTNIMACTFTKDAAEEIKKRVSNDLVDAGTIHSLMWRIIRNHSDFKWFIVKDSEINQMAFAVCKESKLPYNRVSKYLREIGFFKNRFIDYYALLDLNNIPFSEPDVYMFAAEYAKIMKHRHKLDFDDMILYAYDILKNNPEILSFYQELWKYILVDEAQDLSPAQSQVIDMLADKNKNLLLIGDRKQAIMNSFRGSDTTYFNNAEGLYKNMRVFTLPKTYRCSVSVTDKANIVSKLIDGSTIEPVSNNAGKVVVMPVFKTFKDEADAVSEKAIEIFRNTDESIRILFRTNAQSLHFQIKLLRENIPFSSRSEHTIFNRTDVKVGMDAFWLANHFPELSSAEQYEAIRNMRYLVDGDTRDWHKFAYKFKKSKLDPLKNRLEYHDWERYVNALADVKKQYKGKSPSEVLTEVSEMPFVNRIGDADNLIGVADFFSDCETYQDMKDLIEEISKPRFIEAGERAIMLTTIHGSKGLEADNVFVVGVADGLLPLSGGDEDEEFRLFYVAITRARDNLFVSGSVNYGKKALDGFSYMDIIDNSNKASRMQFHAQNKIAEEKKNKWDDFKFNSQSNL